MKQTLAMSNIRWKFKDVAKADALLGIAVVAKTTYIRWYWQNRQGLDQASLQ